MYKEATSEFLAQALFQSWLNLGIFLAVIVLLFVFVRPLPFEKKQTHFLLLLMAFLASIPVFSFGVYLITDSEFHLIRIEAIYEGLKSGQFPVRLSTIFNLNHGLPVNIFYGDFLLYFPALLRFLGLDLGFAFKCFCVFIQILSVYITYFSFSRIFQKRNVALVITLIFITAHFRLASFYMRVAVGEFCAMSFLPLIYLAFYRIYCAPRPYFDFKNVLYLAIGASGMLYSHIITTLLSAVLCTFIALCFIQKTCTWAVIKTFLLGMVLTLSLTAIFWIPFLDYYFQTFTELHALTVLYQGAFIQQNGIDFLQLFDVFSFGILDEAATIFSVSLGLVLLATFLVGTYYLVCQTLSLQLKTLFVFSALLLWLSSSYFPWDILSTLSIFSSIGQLQVPWRWLPFCILMLSLFLGFFILTFSPKQQQNIFYVLILASFLSLTLLYSDYHQQQKPVRVQNAQGLRNLTGTDDEKLRNADPQYLLFGTDLRQLQYTPYFENAQGKIIGENGVNLLLHIDHAQENAFVEIPRFYYPYLHAFTQNALALPSQLGNNNLMRIALPPNYQGGVVVRFLPPYWWRLAEFFSLISALLLVLYLSKKRKTRHNATPTI